MLGAVAGLAAMFLMAAAPAEAVHKGAGDLVCGACHTMHNTQGGNATNLDGATPDGSIVLLRGVVTGREEIHMLCLQCHSSAGTQAGSTFEPHGNTAPKVHIVEGDKNTNVGSIWLQGESYTRIGAGGNFFPEIKADFTMESAGTGWDGATLALGKGHSIGMTNIIPPGGDTMVTALSCTNCHDPHGTATNDISKGINVYRNLKMIPTDSGEATQIVLNSNFSSWVGGITGLSGAGGNYVPETAGVGAHKIWPVYRGASNPPALTDSNSYGGGDGSGQGGISDWCTQCHDAWHEDRPEGSNNSAGGAGAPGDWRRHPVDEVLAVGANSMSGADVQILDFTNYDASIAGRALPVADGDGDGLYYRTGDLDKVMCLSCHFVHGGPYNDNLRWDYTSAVSAGGQTGNAIGSTVGCQLCHNR